MVFSSLRASPPNWASDASDARTPERAVKPRRPARSSRVSPARLRFFYPPNRELARRLGIQEKFEQVYNTRSL